MGFAGKVWKLLVGIKDGLVLIFMLLFFLALFMILSARPSPGQVRDGALLLDLDGYVVEEKSPIDPFQSFLSGEAPVAEYQARDLVRAIDAAASDDRIKAVVLDLSSFLGGGQVHLQAIGEAMERVRKSGKPVLTFGFAYGDDHMHLAAHASEVWLDPLGGALIAGPGGTNLYYGDLIERLKINARVYKVGTYKSAVEPYSRNSMSDEARENAAALYGAMWEEWQANVKKARPKIQLDRVTKGPTEWIEDSKGDLAEAALKAGLVDKLGSHADFGKRVADLVGANEWDKTPGAFSSSDLEAFLAAHPEPREGKAIGVITIAGTIVDGDAGPGTAGGTRIADLLDEALDDDLAALIVRVDSPGGSVTASEEIRRAIARFKAKGIPVAVSFANVAASGGYWVSTASDRIFAQPETITGSIGVFAVLPTFENAAADIGVNADGYRTTPLSGQPDFIDGFTPEIDAILQASVTTTYADFLSRVGKARKMTAAQVDAIAQGRVWDGGSARQNKLVDQFGGIEEALDWAAGKAGLKQGEWHPVYLGANETRYDSLLSRLISSEAKVNAPAARDVFGLAAQQRDQLLGRITSDIQLLSGARGVQAYCLECATTPRSSSSGDSLTLLGQLRSLIAP